MESGRAILLLSAVAAALAVLGSASFSNASAAPAASATTIPLLRAGCAVTVNTLDASKAETGRYVAQLALETLVRLTPSGKIKPGLAQSVVHPNATTYVYHLRHGVKFSDGNELTAADAAYSLKYFGRAGSQVGFGFVSVKSITATDRYTVTVVLKHPDPNWAFDAAENGALIFEKSFQQAHKATFGQPGTLVVGTGPWKIDSLDPTSGAELSANPHWWGGTVPIQHISIKFFSSENSEALAFRSGAIDIVPFPIADPRGFASLANTKLEATPTFLDMLFSMNVHAAPWSDIHVRRAVAYAINRADLVRANGGYATPLTSLLLPEVLESIATPSQVRALIKSLPQYPFSIAKAKAELAKSAYPKGFKVTLDEAPIVNQVKVAQALAGQLNQIGIHASVNAVTTAKWIAEISGPGNKRPPTVVGLGYISADVSGFDAALGSANTKPGQYNTSNWGPADIDRLIAAGESETAPAKRLVIYKKLLTRVATALPYIPLFGGQNVFAVSDRFSWKPDPHTMVDDGRWALAVKAKT